MSKTRIDWADYSINPVKGLCPMACPYCYARRMYKRFKWNPEISYYGMSPMPNPDTPSKIFVGSTMELFHEKTEKYLPMIFTDISLFPEHTFIFLTKQPQNLIKWSPFPENCWVGVSATNDNAQIEAIAYLSRIKAKVRFLSLEPLLEEIILPYHGLENIINWIIIGAQTPYSPKTAPKVEWVEEIVKAADKAKIPVFLKDKLTNIFVRTSEQANKETFQDTFKWALNKDGMYLRQEFPVLPEKRE